MVHWRLRCLYLPCHLPPAVYCGQLFNSADVAVAGRFAGSDALAAVGSNAAVVALFVNVFVGLSVGVNVLVAHYIGQNKKRFHKQVCAYQREVCPYMRNSYACCGNVCGKTDS